MMKKVLLFLAVSAISFNGKAQIQTPQPSPSAKIEQKVGLTDVTLEYSRPGVRGREVFGDLVPYGKVWRTGANENTKITFSDDIVIDGKDLPAGTYAIYTIPKQNEWEVMFYNKTDNWGLPQEWDENEVALKTTVEAQTMPINMETFTIMIDELQNDSAALNFIWDDTVAILKFEVPTDKKATTSIEQVMSGEPGPNDYFAAASYYHDAGKDLEQAYEWIQKATEGEEVAFWVWRRKSLIEADMGKKEAAVESAQKSLAAAEKAGNADYAKMNKDSLEEWGAM
ncbi:DUF2911 domain-containing protein [Salegentibacter sp. F188]|uniref:DUF2911 domain-containing protein n=1 Tax=Autumnicola patrickiae TaxID=3075591 RepID=A0ABU3E3U2_9FLAO|nr:DUF2911 domain-containing protein [Salegentibacter sp. F188]MDT0690664.1 DUF2911 domain-containing protein [Salegentibacter sp. F188]